MKRNILGQSPYTYKKQLNRRILGCTLLFLLTVALNIVFTALRTEQNHVWMLLLNILADILCGCFLVYYVNLYIIPRSRLYRLMCRDKIQLQGTVSCINTEYIRYMDVDCHSVTVGGRRLFLPADTIALKEGQSYTFHLVSNIIAEAEP